MYVQIKPRKPCCYYWIIISIYIERTKLRCVLRVCSTRANSVLSTHLFKHRFCLPNRSRWENQKRTSQIRRYRWRFWYWLFKNIYHACWFRKIDMIMWSNLNMNKWRFLFNFHRFIDVFCQLLFAPTSIQTNSVYLWFSYNSQAILSTIVWKKQNFSFFRKSYWE